MKNQIKKSLSLLMAVLMILSCWVWVAPEKAEAASTPGTYKFELVCYIENESTNGGHAYVYYYPWKADGSGVDTSKKTQYTGQEFNSLFRSGQGTTVTYTIPEVPGWPCEVFIQVNHKTLEKEIIKLREIRIEGINVCGGEWTFKNKSNKTINCNKTNDTGSPTTWAWNVPSPKEISSLGVSNDVDISKLPNGVSATAEVSVSGIKDQYGVEWPKPLPTLSNVSYTLKYTNSAGAETALASTYGTISGSSNSATATFYDDVQTLFPNSTNGKVYAHVTYNGKTKSTPVNLTFPTYDITFNANGGKIGFSDSDGQDSITVKGIKYQGVIGKSPAYRAKAGFDFKGFYSVQNSDATGLTPSFSGTLYKDSETTVDAAGDCTWYAAWQAKPITATFMTADNQLIGTVEGRYNNFLTATNMYNGLSGLNAKVKEAYSGTNIKFDSSYAPIYKDGDTTYTFAGWKIIKAYDESVMDKDETTVLKGDVTFQAVYKKADAKKYTVSFEDGAGKIYKDANGNEATKSDYNYRDAVTGIPSSVSKADDDRYSYTFIGWAKKLANVNYFAVDENDCGEDGVKLSYTSKDAAEFIVKGDATYVPVFRMSPREYTVTYKYTVDGGTTASITVGGYHWNDKPSMPDIKDNYTNGGLRCYLTGWTIEGDETGNEYKLEKIAIQGDMTLNAVYGDFELAKYIINFYGKDATGEKDILLSSDTYEDGDPVIIPDASQSIDTADALYTFAGWSPYVNTTATADADYYATYTKKTYADVHFYNYDGTLIYSLDGKENGLFEGETIPAYENLVQKEDGTFENVLPTKPEDPVGTYTFNGWVNSAGEKVEPDKDILTGDTFLTADFTTKYKNYTVTFVNDVQDEDGNNVVVLSKTYHYGAPIDIPADPVKAADEAYSYTFRGWSPDVSEVCYGDATYTATYRRAYNYYTVTWFKDNKSTVLSTSNYKYGAKIQQTVFNEPEYQQAAETGKKWVFKHWVQCDENGNDILVDGKQVIFTRGKTTMGAEALYFYPVFEQKANTLTVTFNKIIGTDENGNDVLKPIGTATVDYNTSLSASDEAKAFEKDVAKTPDEYKHYKVEKWVDAVTGADVTNVTTNVSVKPVYSEEAHTKTVDEITKDATCTETGLANMICTVCEKTWKDVVIEKIEDTSAPIGQIYVGSKVWTSNDDATQSAVTYIGPDTKLVVNAEDTGSRTNQNPDGVHSRGVGKIEYYLSDVFFPNTDSITSGWTIIYSYEAVTAQILEEVLKTKGMSMADYDELGATDKAKVAIDAEVAAIQATYKANATGVVSNLGLENGENYVIYIRVTDREVDGTSNSKVFCSGKLYYDTTAPEITLTGEGHGAKFCEKVSVRVTDNADELKIYLDGEEVEAYTNPGTTSANGTFVASFDTAVKGAHTVTAIDKNGNKTTQTFEIKGNHTTRHYIINASCENTGSVYDLCIVCGEKSNEDVIPALGHNYENYYDKAQTCVDDGYRTYVCDNNCGIKLVVNPTDGPDVFAKIPAEHAEAIKALKATGMHTYAKVQDENGMDTDVDAWVIDKAPTCIEKGAQHKDCTVCGVIGRVTEVIDVDKVNGHKFYRASVTTEPTCTTQGEKTKTCRYCGYKEHVEYIDALGHTDGEYKVITVATCEAKGSKVLTCSACKDENNNPTVIGEPVEIPALGHAWKVDSDVYQGEDGNYYIDYVCNNDNNHKKHEIQPDYEPPVAATVTFDFNGGYYTIPAVGNPNQFGYVPEMIKGTQTLNAYVGESISKTEVKTAFKPENATKTYTFSHWADAQGNEVKFPIEVKGDATYYAVYTERYVNYTITYLIEEVNAAGGIETKEYKKTGYLHNGETVALVDGPSKAGDKLNNYTFAGWAVKVNVEGEDGTSKEKLQVVDNNEVTINGENVNLYATFNEVRKQYAVTYAYSSSNILETFAVEAGTVARDCKIPVEKAFDTKYHYEFIKWNRADENKDTGKYEIKVESNIYTTPVFEAVEHVYVITEETPAACGVKAVDRYTCACGYTFTKDSSDPVPEHNWGTPVYNEETGKNIITCTREGCGASEEDTRKFTAKFFKNNEDTSAFKTIPQLEWGTIITDIPVAPEKNSTSTTDYIFKGWAVKGTTEIVDFSKLPIKNNCEFVAVYEEIAREYTVTFGYDSYNLIQVIYNVTAGSSVAYDLRAYGEPKKAPDAKGHYIFTGWSGSTENVQSNVHVNAVFTRVDHTYVDYELTTATCTNAKGIRHQCACGFYYDDSIGNPLPHTMVEIDRKNPTETEDGWIKYECSVCGKPDEITLPAQPTTANVVVTVDRNGAAAPGIKVVVQVLGEDVTPITGTTNAKGVATIEIAKDKEYSAWVEIDGVLIPVALTKNSEGNFNGYYSIKVEADNDADCGCACHRTNFWGTIFRFFHKIIKLFTGEFKCCKNPDPMYG